MWQTHITFPVSELQFTHQSKILSLGSCFADEVGTRLQALRFDALVNPFGILYNPVSLAQNMALISRRLSWDVEECFEHQGLWRHFDFHSRLSKQSRTDFIENVQKLILRSHHQLKDSSLILLTMGSSFVWESSHHGVVGNCHKLPSSNFTRRMLNSDEIHQALKSICRDIKSVTPTCKIILTVSPVRHMRDGIIDNSWSKSRLIDGCRVMEQTHDDVAYFASYEIMMDELRDYRFYRADMVHPSEEAVDYIFAKFFETHFNTVPEDLLLRIKKINRNLSHRPIDPTSEAHHKFIGENNEMIEKVREKYGIEM